MCPDFRQDIALSSFILCDLLRDLIIDLPFPPSLSESIKPLFLTTFPSC
jgi:hypothetical protein